jgi:hypothetical protein
MSAPKLFISYSWSNPEHEQLVVDIATELRESGVDVILDKWDLKEGHDAVAFMEKMVTDPEIKKVAIICDNKYSVKADGRAGGVGTETQIISKEVYENQSQEKFVAVVTEKDEHGKPFLPTYYKSRIYIDLSEADRYAENFERLLRWIFDKPLYVKPKIGNKSSFLSESEHVSLGTTALFKRCVDAIKNHKAYAEGAFDEYCNLFVSNLERFRLSKPEGEFDDAVVKNIEEFLPYRNEVIQLFTTVVQYAPTTEFTQRIHRLFENLIPYMNRPANITQWIEWDFDNFKFIVHELFLYVLAILLKHDRLDQANYLLEQQYYYPGKSDYGMDAMVGFLVFWEHLPSLENRNKRLQLSRLSLRADLLKERCNGTGIDFRYLMQADFVAFMRSEVEANDPWGGGWVPETLLYLGHFNSPFEIFARSVSKAYFDRVKVLLAIDTPKDLEPLFKSYQDGSRILPRWERKSFSPLALIGYEHLATRP